jgi:predicted nucleic acid-binding Zn ribbon protein
MVTYVYETIPQKAGDSPRQFELRQHMADAPLERHPDTGEPVRRVISGGYGYLKKGGDAPAQHAHGGHCCSGGGCGCN